MIPRKILDFFSRSERGVVLALEKHVDIASQASRHLESMMDRFVAQDLEGIKVEYLIINRLESEADSHHRAAVGKISGGSFFGGIREDLLDLFEKIDSVADSSKNAGRLLLRIRASKEMADDLLKAGVKELLSNCSRSVESLRLAVRALGTSKKETITRSIAVEDDEEAADRVKERILDRLLEMSSKYPVYSVIQLRDFVNMADDIADFAEDASDELLVLVAKGYS